MSEAALKPAIFDIDILAYFDDVNSRQQNHPPRRPRPFSRLGSDMGETRAQKSLGRRKVKLVKMIIMVEVVPDVEP